MEGGGGGVYRPRRSRRAAPIVGGVRSDRCADRTEARAPVAAPSCPSLVDGDDAVQHGHEGCVKRLLDAGANRNTVFENNWTLAHLAASCPRWGVLKILTDETSSPLEVNRQTTPEGYTPLHLALHQLLEHCLAQLAPLFTSSCCVSVHNTLTGIACVCLQQRSKATAHFLMEKSSASSLRCLPSLTQSSTRHSNTGHPHCCSDPLWPCAQTAQQDPQQT